MRCGGVVSVRAGLAGVQGPSRGHVRPDLWPDRHICRFALVELGAGPGRSGLSCPVCGEGGGLGAARREPPSDSGNHAGFCLRS